MISCLAALCVGNMMLDNIYGLMPIYIIDQNPKAPCEPDDESCDPNDETRLNGKWTDEGGGNISTVQTTLILSIFSVAQIVFAPFNAWIKNKMGAKNTLLIGFVMITVTTFGLGLLSLIKNSQSFLIVALILRFFQGQGDVFLQFVGYSIICTVFADDIMKHIA